MGHYKRNCGRNEDTLVGDTPFEHLDMIDLFIPSKNPPREFSNKLQLPAHVLRLQAITQEVQEPHNLANRMGALLGVNNPRVVPT